jgi:uncharacterized membrane protein YqjE
MHTVEAIMMTVMSASMLTMALSMLIVHYYWILMLLIVTAVLSVVGTSYFSWKTVKCLCGTGCEHCNEKKKMNDESFSCQP